MAYTTIDKSDDYFNTLTYTGDGTDNRSITGLGFQPDFCWFKDRTGTNSHNLFDSVRGVQKPLRSDSNGAELSGFDLFDSFDSDGFTVSGATADNTNFNGNNFVAWNWLGANGTASNTDGSITSTVSANTTSGFSIVSYTGTGSNATVGHGLGSALDMIIVKNRDDSVSWNVWHNALDGDEVIKLDSDAAKVTSSTRWNSTIPTSSVFSVGTANGTNGSSDDLIAYCFAEKKGFSKFGNYTGNGSSNGTFIYTGMRPSFVLTKASSSTGQWIIHDTARDPFNQTNRVLYPSLSNAEENNISDQIDILSNGFKIKATGSAINGSGVTYIYMAFAENPFVTSTGIPATAR